MNRTLKNSLLIIAIIVVATVTSWLIYYVITEESVNVAPNVADENAVRDDTFANTVTNKQVGTNNEESKNKVTDNTIPSINTETLTSKEGKAIELVKRQWGEIDGVYFTNESIDSSGRYIVSVRNQSTTSSLAFFIVDINTGVVTKK